jgi:hypothetical protein
MKSLTLLFTLVLSTNFCPAHAQSFRELELIINQSSILSATCEPRTCTLSPRKGVSVQAYKSEVSFVKKHLDGLGVKLKEDANGIPR